MEFRFGMGFDVIPLTRVEYAHTKNPPQKRALEVIVIFSARHVCGQNERRVVHIIWMLFL